LSGSSCGSGVKSTCLRSSILSPRLRLSSSQSSVTATPSFTPRALARARSASRAAAWPSHPCGATTYDAPGKLAKPLSAAEELVFEQPPPWNSPSSV